MRILAFESSAKAASVALTEDGRLAAEYFENSGLTHSRTLMQMAADLLRSCDVAPEGVDAVAVAAGPGSFTGVRIGVAAAKGFAWGREIPCFGVSTLEAMAFAAGRARGLLCAVMDARCKQVYTALFRSVGGRLQRLSEDAAIPLQELQERLSQYQEPIFLVGDGAQLCYDAYGSSMPHLRLAPEHLRYQHAAGLCTAAWEAFQQGRVCSAQELAPIYLRLPQAERERMARMKQNTEESKS